MPYHKVRYRGTTIFSSFTQNPREVQWVWSLLRDNHCQGTVYALAQLLQEGRQEPYDVAAGEKTPEERGETGVRRKGRDCLGLSSDNLG